MERLTKLEIQRALLAGQELTWTNSAGKREKLQLLNATQRRLFAFLLETSIREPKNLTDEFIAGISNSYAAENDPAHEAKIVTPEPQTGPWRLQKIETEGFGGINVCSGPTFSYDFDGESIILQGPNGSGKSSLVGAIIWAMAGERPRDHEASRPEDRAEVYDHDNRKIGTWPPIACYPEEPHGLIGDPFVRVTLTFIDSAGTSALVERRLENGRVTSSFDPALNALEVLIETGLLMPSRMPQLRFEKGQTPITRAVQSLTGLDDLIEIGALVDGLCHKGREYLSTNQKQIQYHKTLFESALSEAQRAIRPTGEYIETFPPSATANIAGPFAQVGKNLRARVAQLTDVIQNDLADGLDPTNAQTQHEITKLIISTQNELDTGLQGLSTWITLSSLQSAFTEDAKSCLHKSIANAEKALAEAIALDKQSQNDTRLQLKALGAHWHENNLGASDVENCPLCGEKLKNNALVAEIQQLRKADRSATRRLEDNANAIRAELLSAIPLAIRPKIAELAALQPRRDLISEIERRLITKLNTKSSLTTFIRLVREALALAPEAEIPLAKCPISTLDSVKSLESDIANFKRILLLAQWSTDNFTDWQTWWFNAVGTKELLAPAEGAIVNGDMMKEKIAQHLMRIYTAIAEAEPYRAAADALSRAWKSGKDANHYQNLQDHREAIVEKIISLKSLGSLAEAQARLSIDTLSGEISAILKRMHLSNRFEFKGTQIQQKTGIQVRGGFFPDIKVDATLVANTSWLRAVLWAFLFALRAEAVKQIGSDPLPLLILDDPQATFDAEHRRRWAQEVIALQQDATPTQVILVTHDEIFIDLIKNIDGITGRQGIIVAAGREIGHLGLFEGAAIERKWSKACTENSPAAAQQFISDVRVHVEGLLRLMLRGQAAEVIWATHGFVMGEAREKVNELHGKKLAPWDKSEFKTLVGQLDKGNVAIKALEMAHHAGRNNLAMADAVDVEQHWRVKLEPALRRAFNLARDHFLIHGGLRALHAAEPGCILPEGYTAKVKSLRFHLLGRASALSGGAASDGCVDLDLSAASASPIVLGRHFAFRLTASTLEPVARKGDILIIREMSEPSPNSLVVARCESRVVARRFEIADNHSDIAVLTAYAVNPRAIAQPVVVKRSTIKLHKIIGVLFDSNATYISSDEEICDCGGESILNRYASDIKGLVEINGHSAEPVALNGQMLMIGNPIHPSDALTRFDGRPVIAGDADGNRYFKRLRRTNNSTIVLESLEISGDFAPVILTFQTNSRTDLKEIWPVYGVLFEKP